MKKPLFKIIFFGIALAAITLPGCKKDKPENLTESPSNHPYSTKSSQLFPPNTMKWDELVSGYDDTDSRRRHARLFLSIGLTEVVKDPRVAAWIVSEAPKHPDNVFYFDRLFEKFPQTKAIMESVADPLGLMTGWSFEQVQEEMQYGPYEIKASIYLCELNDPIGDITPIVTPGDDIDEDPETFADVVLGWCIDGNNQVSRVNLNKHTVARVNTPILAIDGRAKNIGNLINREGPAVPLGDPQPFNPAQPPDYANHRISITKYQIGHRYDNNGHSELEIAGRMIYTPTYNSGAGASIRSFLREGGCYSGRTEHYRLADVHKSNMWVMINTDRFFCWLHSPVPQDWMTGELDYNYVTDPSSPTGYSYQPRKILIFNTYELDDFTSDKELAPTFVNGVWLGMTGKMTNYDEWYQFDPAAGSNVWWGEYGRRLHISQMTIGWNQGLWVNPIKGMLEFKTTGFCNY